MRLSHASCHSRYVFLTRPLLGSSAIDQKERDGFEAAPPDGLSIVGAGGAGSCCWELWDVTRIQT